MSEVRQDGNPSEEKVGVLARAVGRAGVVGLSSFPPSFFFLIFIWLCRVLVAARGLLSCGLWVP